MRWLKRNLVLVIGGLVALGLLGLAGYFLFIKIKQNDDVTAQLDVSTAELKRLVNRDPHPGTAQVKNIAAAKDEHIKVKAFLDQVKSHFSPPPSTNQLSSREFRALLDNTVNELRRGAEASGVQVEKDYWFTFAAQKTAVNFPTNQVGNLATQLAEIRALCKVLYEAKVLGLSGIKRAAVTTDDSGYTDYVTNKMTTNAWAIVTPYEVTFDGFSSELAAVLDGLLRSQDCFVVKNMTAEKVADAQANEAETPQMSDPYRRYGGMMDPRYGGRSPSGGNRYGLEQRYRQQPPVAPTRPLGKGGLDTALEEKTLRITLQLNSVKLKDR